MPHPLSNVSSPLFSDLTHLEHRHAVVSSTLPADAREAI